MCIVIWFNGTRFEVHEDGIYSNFCGYTKMSKHEIDAFLRFIS